jgi:MFS transporter, DHA1 family, tetracycline resistance protein
MSATKPAREPMPRGYWTIWTTVAIDLIGFGIVAPLLPLYAKRFGASGFTTGALFASFSLAQMVFAPVMGRLSDRIGRKPVILISLFGTAVGSLLTGLAGSLPLLFVGRLLDGASGASVSVAQGAVADLSPPRRRAKLMGMLGAAFGVGFVLGPAIGGLASLGSHRLPFFVAAAIAAINGVVAIVRLPETVGKSVGASVHPPQAGSRRTQLLRLAAIGLLSITAFGAFEAMFSRFGATRFRLTEGSVSVVFVCVGVWLVIVQGGLVGRVSSALGNVRSLRVGLGVMAVGLVSLALTHSWWQLALSLALLGFGQGITGPNLTARVVEVATERRRGAALGFQQSAGAAARVVGPLMAGWLFDRGVSLPFAVAAGVAAVALVLAIQPE